MGLLFGTDGLQAMACRPGLLRNALPWQHSGPHHVTVWLLWLYRPLEMRAVRTGTYGMVGRSLRIALLPVVLFLPRWLSARTVLSEEQRRCWGSEGSHGAGCHDRHKVYQGHWRVAKPLYTDPMPLQAGFSSRLLT